MPCSRARQRLSLLNRDEWLAAETNEGELSEVMAWLPKPYANRQTISSSAAQYPRLRRTLLCARRLLPKRVDLSRKMQAPRTPSSPVDLGTTLRLQCWARATSRRNAGRHCIPAADVRSTGDTVRVSQRYPTRHARLGSSMFTFVVLRIEYCSKSSLCSPGPKCCILKAGGAAWGRAFVAHLRNA